MKKRTNFVSIAVSAALLLSGCGTGTPAPAVSESETTTSAAETTTAEVTTTAATTTTASTTTTIATTAEPEKVPVQIKSAGHRDERVILSELKGNYPKTTEEYQENIWFGNDDYYDKVRIIDYQLGDATSDFSEDGKSIVINSDAANYKVRNSTNAFSDSSDNDIEDRIKISMFGDADKFGSAYEIKYDDPTASVTKFVYNENSFPDYYADKKIDKVNNIILGYTIDTPVTVNAFVCHNEDGSLSVLIDPEYMYGLPMFTLNDVSFMIGDTKVVADSLLFSVSTAEGLSLDTADYAYAKVTMQDTHVVYSKQKGYANTCTVSDIEVIKPFSDIAELDITHDTDIISSVDKDPQMKEIYDTIMNAKADIFGDDTYGIILLDLDFDEYPELLVTSVIETEEKYIAGKYMAKTDVYRMESGSLKKIDTLELARLSPDGRLGYIGLSALPDGTKAWYVNWYDDQDYLLTLYGDTFTKHPLFTKEPTDDPIMLNGEPTQKLGGEADYTDYLYMGERMVPNIVMKPEPYSESDELTYETPEWHGINSYFGMWELFGFARAEYANSNIETSYDLFSDWLGDLPSYADPQHFDVTDREFAHKIAYMVDDFYNGRSNGVEHNYWFLGAYAKPVIYLYPEEQTDISVQVNFPLGGEFTCTYPEYGDGWNVTAMPDGTLYDANGDEYYCLYWEGKGAADFDMSKGFCVAGTDTAKFLREKLMYIGLTAREANEFIIYWLPKMQDNPYNVITLHTDDYARSVPLTVSPAPDTQIRVFMTYYSSDTPVDIPEQELPHYERNGFTLVEWGGSEG